MFIVIKVMFSVYLICILFILVVKDFSLLLHAVLKLFLEASAFIVNNWELELKLIEDQKNLLLDVDINVFYQFKEF